MNSEYFIKSFIYQYLEDLFGGSPSLRELNKIDEDGTWIIKIDDLSKLGNKRLYYPISPKEAKAKFRQERMKKLQLEVH